MRTAGATYTPDIGDHAGHTVTVVAVNVPGERMYGDEIAFVDETWVECECGARWGYVDPYADEQAKDHGD